VSRFVFRGVIENPIWETTGWSDHEKLAVTVDFGHRYNGQLVKNHVSIVQLDQDDIEALDEADRGGPAVDTSDFIGDRIVTDIAGARKLAALLIAAAEKAEAGQ
jgi:hypothetical protein